MIEPWIETFTGKRMYFLEPTPEMICIEDIAHALSNICRFGGHVTHFYSVAEHSVNVSILAENKLEGLLHDASEAYLVDIPKPIKAYLSNYKDIETKLMEAIGLKFGAGWPLCADTHDADATQLKEEAKYIMTTGGREWVANFPTKRDRGVAPECYIPTTAERIFLNRFNELTR